ncbi:group 1 truncated hemoglobin [Planosporangium thailandense]|uniref:Group 1 truncated hemoglobin n=1 Tax=Planosporangium thailandense TaxID=765197 RepID=A0ABX0Y146_9ACTN|nr:group 1 truncated hemoglobin [Planosporangium thailandense]NJC72076.1 group 1 truncated hemoglobin [Planosporangium thailandense]
MYDRLGGGEVVRSVVERLYVLIIEDEQLHSYFDNVDLASQKRHMAALLSQVLGGPKEYDGRALAVAHAPLGITAEHYARVGDYLTAALLVAHAPRDIIDAVGDVLTASRSQIVAESMVGAGGLAGQVG